MVSKGEERVFEQKPNRPEKGSVAKLGNFLGALTEEVQRLRSGFWRESKLWKKGGGEKTEKIRDPMYKQWRKCGGKGFEV